MAQAVGFLTGFSKQLSAVVESFHKLSLPVATKHTGTLKPADPGIQRVALDKDRGTAGSLFSLETNRGEGGGGTKASPSCFMAGFVFSWLVSSLALSNEQMPALEPGGEGGGEARARGPVCLCQADCWKQSGGAWLVASLAWHFSKQ